MSENDPKLGNVIDHGYFEWLQGIAGEKTVYFRPPMYPGMKGELIPWDEIAAKHSGFFLDSTIAWMMAHLLWGVNSGLAEVDEIGLWGVDFATDEERRKQRKGTKHFIELFKMKGIPCFIPEVSDMVFDPPPYPAESTLAKKIKTHQNLLAPEQMKTAKMIQNLEETLATQKLHLERIKGTMQTLDYFRDNWA